MSDKKTSRRLAAILAGDIAGYSRLMGIDEEGTHQQFKLHRKQLVDPKIREHRGRIVKNTGDGFLVEFSSAMDAVRCAVEIQRRMAERNVAVRLEKRIEFRVGINVGDIIIEDRDIFGDGVNIAARLETIAEPGGICVSDKVHQEIRGKLDVFARDIGLQTLKNIAEPVRVYEIALAAIKPRLEDLGAGPSSFAWPAKNKPNAEPYPGLLALGEDDAGIFFGRDADIMSGLTKLQLVRRRGSPRLFVIEAASGAGKSSYLRAGLWPRLQRDRDFAPLAILRPAQGILTGPDGLGFQLAPWFSRYGRPKTPGAINAALGETAEAFGALIAEATAVCTASQRATAPDARPPAPLIAIDQGEELFAVEDAQESTRLLQLLAGVLKAAADRVDLYVLITIRADSVERLLQRIAELGLEPPEALYLLPLSPSAYRDVILRPADVYNRNVRRLAIEPALADRLVADATGADALPLLAFTLSQLFKLHGAGHELTLAQYNDMGGMGGCVTRVLRQAQKSAGTAGSDNNLRRLIVPGLATWDPAANAAKRLVAKETALVGGTTADDLVARALSPANSFARIALAPLSYALVENRLLVRNQDTLEVAHEALLRRPPIAGWLEEQKDALKLRDDVLREAEEWSSGGRQADALVRRGARLDSAVDLLGKPDFVAAMAPAAEYLAASKKLAAAGRRRVRLVQAVIYTLFLCIIAGLVGFINQAFLREQYQWRIVMRPSVLTEEQEREKAAKPGSDFKECANGCPTMIALPAGKFTMGSPVGEKDRNNDEGPQRVVTIGQPFAVGKTAVTFAEWDTCVAAGACPKAEDSGWGRDDRPVTNVSWDEAKIYTTWLAKQTGKPYRLLTEAEWEYAARAGSPRRYFFGDEETQLGEYAWFSKNSDSKTQPVGTRKPNAFGLYDIYGNVWQWVEDCYEESYSGAPTDGSAATSTACSRRVLRGGSWSGEPDMLRSANRNGFITLFRIGNVGFRVARTLKP
jgi:formylglycine-generating enzyme required for sulfatase activity/class 3 adenylate cyclase